MVKKALKVIMIVIMLLGIAFSISNFISMELKAKNGEFDFIDWPDGTFDCMAPGNECDIEMEL